MGSMDHDVFLRLLHSVMGAGEAVILNPSAWRQLVDGALRLNVASPVYPRLRAIKPDIELLEPLRHAYTETTARNLRLFRDLDKVIVALNINEIPFILLKGAYLASFVYTSIGQRPMCDADLLIRKTDLKRVQDLLLGLGYGPRDPATVEEQARHGHQLNPFSRGGSILEIHWRIDDEESSFTVDSSGLWLRARHIILRGHPIMALSPVDLLLHLCLNVSYDHGWLPFGKGLLPFADIATVASTYATIIDWSELCSRAQEWKIEHCVYLTLRLAKILWGADIPAGVFHQWNHLIRMETRWLAVAQELIMSSHYRRFLDRFPTVGHLRWVPPHGRQTPYWKRAIFPSTEILFRSYPSLEGHWWSFISRIVRWCDVVAQHFDFWVPTNTDSISLVHLERQRVRLENWLGSPSGGHR